MRSFSGSEYNCQTGADYHQYNLSRDERLSSLLMSSLAKEMSKPEHLQSALLWRGLHLSRAKLKASSRTSALLSGFAMVAMVELQVTNDSANPVPTALLITFTVCTTLLVSVHMLALMISTCILPHVEAVASVHGLAAVSESPHKRMHYYIEIAWASSTVLGIFLFLVDLAILCWVKFWEVSGTDGKSGQKAALAASVLLIPICFIFIAFAIHFYRSLTSHKTKRQIGGVQELETMYHQLQTEQENSTFVPQSQSSLDVKSGRSVLNI